MATKRLSTIQQYDGIEPESQEDDLSHVLMVVCARHERGVLKRDERNRVTSSSDDDPTEMFWYSQNCDVCTAMLNPFPDQWA